jgi:hypothetical protein
MNNLLEMILAARKKGGGFEWIVPLIFVGVYIVGGIAKMRAAKKEGAAEPEEKPGALGGEGKLRYKALDGTAAARRPAPKLRSVQPRAKQLPYAKPSAQPTAQRPTPRQPRPVAPGPQPIVRPIPVQARREGQIQVPRPRPRPAPAAPRPWPKHKRAEPKPAPRVAQKPRLPQKPAAAVVSEPPAQIVRKRRTLRQDLSGSSNLQRAIIYSEILGKPLALRDM